MTMYCGLIFALIFATNGYAALIENPPFTHTLSNYIGPLPLTNLATIQVLRIVKCNITSDGLATLPAFPNVKALSIIDSNLKTIDYFGRLFPLLTDLLLMNNNIDLFSIDTMNDFHSLRSLAIVSQTLPILRNNFLIGLPNLRELSIRYSKVHAVEENAFNGLHQLVRLDLSHNDIDWIPGRSLSTLTELETLDLDYNHIRKFNIDSLLKLLKLKTIDLRSNLLTASDVNLAPLTKRHVKIGLGNTFVV